MKTLLCAVAVAAALSTAASAGSPVTVVAPAPAVVAPAPAMAATDWSGFYLGGAYTGYTASETFLGDFDGSGYGGFAGYNFQRGSMVYGAELEFGMGEYDTGTFSGDLDSLNLKARVGYAFDSVMVYGFAGASSITADFGGTMVDYAGYSYGVGGAYQFHNGLFAGLEYTAHDLVGSGSVDGQDLTSGAGAIRVGWQF